MINNLIDDLKLHCNVKSIFSNLKKTITTFTIKGRSNRAEFLTFFLVHLAFSISIINVFKSTEIYKFLSGLTTIDPYAVTTPTLPIIPDSTVYMLMFCLVLFLILEIILFLLIARRLHDSGRSAWWYLLVYVSSMLNHIIPVAQTIVILCLGLLPPENKDNEYGKETND